MKRVKMEGEIAVYHCISRVVAGERLLDDAAKEVLRRMLWKTAEFCGVEILAYCLMSNHFHILVRVSPADCGEEGEGLGRAEILKRYRRFYGELPSSPGFPTAAVLAARFAEGGDEAERWEARLRARMGDVSEFMKTLKQRFTVWFNKTHRRFGTLWSERYKSVLVENSAFALKTVAAYIDLNPVRAGLVEDPADYRWCSYAEAMAGNREILKQYAGILGSSAQTDDPQGDLESYRVVLYGKGGVSKTGAPALASRRVDAVLKSGGRLSIGELARAKTGFLTKGVVIGTRSFLEAVSAGRTEFGGAVGPPTKLKSSKAAVIPLTTECAEEVELLAMRRPRGYRK
jgi:REP element-mobilizing transposase RayT